MAGLARPGWLRRGRGSAGFVTAETAVVLPALMLVMAVVLTLARAAAIDSAAQDAAAVAARAAARGEPDDAVRRLATRFAPNSATVSVTRGGGVVRVSVRVPVLPRGAAARLLPGFEVTAESVAADELRPPVSP